jgi:hypothetical protein
MKDKALGVFLIIMIAFAIAAVSYVAHRVGDPALNASTSTVVVTLVSLMGLAIMWLKQSPTSPTVATTTTTTEQVTPAGSAPSTVALVEKTGGRS